MMPPPRVDRAWHARWVFAAVLLVLLGRAITPAGQAHKEIVPVIAGTNRALADARALALPLHLPEKCPWAMSTTPGACPPDLGAALFAKDQSLPFDPAMWEAVQPHQAAIRSAIQQHGDLSPAYVAEMRRLSLAAWHDLDRTRLFEEEPLP